jgi:hypothetical protein
MSRDLENEVNELRRDLETGFKMARPTEKFRATMILATLELRVIAEQFKNSQDPKERRRLINEYEKQKESIEKGIQMLSQQTRRFGTIHASPQN